MSAESDLRRAVARLERAEAAVTECRAVVRAATLAAREAGVTHQQLADILGVTRQRVAQILRESGAS